MLNLEKNWSGYLHSDSLDSDSRFLAGNAMFTQDEVEWRVGLSISRAGQGAFAVEYHDLERGGYGLPGNGILDNDGKWNLTFHDGSSLVLEPSGKGDSLAGWRIAGNRRQRIELEPGNQFLVPGREGNVATQSTMGLVVDSVFNGTRKHIHSLAVSHHGKLVLDEYFYGYGPDKFHQLRSITKSILSILFGIAVGQGLLSLDQKLYDFFPDFRKRSDWDRNRDAITLRMLLEMRSGLDRSEWEEPKYASSQALYVAPDWLDFCLALPLTAPPGTKFFYSSPVLTPLGVILEKVSGMNVATFAQRFLYGPLDIKADIWMHGPKETFLLGTGHRLRPRDMVKIGELFLNQGMWNGIQVLSREWIQLSATARSMPEEVNGYSGYGLLWWTRSRVINGKTISYYSANGNGGQKIAVVPSEELVVVITAGNYGRSNAPTEDLFTDVLEALVKQSGPV